MLFVGVGDNRMTVSAKVVCAGIEEGQRCAGIGDVSFLDVDTKGSGSYGAGIGAERFVFEDLYRRS